MPTPRCRSGRPPTTASASCACFATAPSRAGCPPTRSRTASGSHTARRAARELAELVSDVRPARGPRRLLLAAIEWLSALDADIEAAWARPRVPSLALPSTDGARMTVGRSPSCDCVLPEDCVSRRHAELRRDGERWFLRDLGSSNGTRVNGVRVIEAIEVRPGDRLSLGGAAYRLRRGSARASAAPPRPPRRATAAPSRGA